MRTSLLVVAALAATPRAADAASCIPGFDFAVFAEKGILIQGNASTDSYDSSAGTYAATKVCGDGDLGTNATSGGAIQIQSASTKVCGDVTVGRGGNPKTVVQQHSNASVTGVASAATTNTSLPLPTFPTLPNAANQNPTFQNTAGSIAPGFRYKAVQCKNGSLTLAAGKYIVESLLLEANCELVVGSGPIEVYFTSALQLQGGAIANASGVAGNLTFYGGASASTVTVQGGPNAAFAVYAPRSQCQVQGNADVYGALVCESAQVQGNGHVHYDRALQTVAGGGFACPSVEVSRATPIATMLDNESVIVQGTYEVPTMPITTISGIADVATFAFPYIKGHMRARTTASISTTASAFSSGTILFDAATKIPPASTSGCNALDGTCRNVFTVTQQPAANGVSLRPPRVPLDDANASAIGALIAPASVVPGIGATQWRSIVRKVVAGKLGGVDRSTVAVIGPSPLAGHAARPTIVYFGATDGMLHAVCASTGGTTESDTNICRSLGSELWAFMPRVQLPLVRRNLQRIDGSVRVVDVFGDFDGTGARSFRTILTFQTGYADATLGGAAVYALDVTDPANPTVIWEHTKPSAPEAYALGTGLALAAGTTLIQNKPVNLVIAQTSNGGTAGAGVVATAIDLETGQRRWLFGYAYPSPPRNVAADAPLPATGIPGGAVAVDLARRGFMTHVVMGDLYGNLWKLDVTTGESATRDRNGAMVSMFQFSTNKKPIGSMPAIYSDGNRQFAVFASGGYVDPLLATWSAGTQALVAIALDVDGPYPITEASSKLAIKQSLAAGHRALAQVLVVGKELFLTTDGTDVNATGFGTGAGDTGRVTRIDLQTAATISVTTRAGAASLAHVGTQLFSSNASRQQQVSLAAASTAGESVDSAVISQLARRLWLRLQ